jgi:DUF971 family protein
MDRVLRSTQTNSAAEDHTSDTVTTQEEWVIAIEQVEYVAEYILRLKFDDGKEVTIDFAPFLHQSLNPLIRKYLDIERFKRFALEYGDLNWDDYDLCFPIADLYEGRI